MLVHAIAHGGVQTLPHRRIEPASAACRSDALPIELHPRPTTSGGMLTDLFYLLDKKEEEEKKEKKTHKKKKENFQKASSFKYIYVRFCNKS